MKFPEKQFNRLTKAIDWSNRQLEFPRKKRLEALRQYIGHHYSQDGAAKKVPVSFLKLAIQTYIRSLASRSPRAMISTSNPALKPTAKNLELAVNLIPEEIGLTETLRQFVMEAMFSMGIVKVGIHATGEVLGHEYGEPFVDNVWFDDYFADMSAKHRDRIQFEGNDYWLEAETCRKLGWGKKEELEEDESTVRPDGTESSESIGIGSGQKVSYKRRVHVRDVWLPQERVLVTYGVNSKKLYDTVEWEGPEYGPYIKLGYSEVPGNLLPLPPVAVWRDLHELSNALFRKIAQQADDQKDVLGFQGDDDDGVDAFKKAKSGDGIKYTGAAPQNLKAGGVDAKSLAFFLQLRDITSYFYGNLDTLGGLAAQTETVGQDRLLSQAASAAILDMQGMTVDAVRKIFRSLCYYEWYDPIKTRTLEKPIPGTDGDSINVDWSRESKIGNFNSYELDIDVHTLVDDSPTQKLQRLGLVVQSYVIPLMPEIQRQGGVLNVQKLLGSVAKLSDLKELDEIVTFATTEENFGAPGEQPPAQPGQPEGGGGGGGVQSNEQDMMAQLLSGEGSEATAGALLGG